MIGKGYFALKSTTCGIITSLSISINQSSSMTSPTLAIIPLCNHDNLFLPSLEGIYGTNN